MRSPASRVNLGGRAPRLLELWQANPDIPSDHVFMVRES